MWCLEVTKEISIYNKMIKLNLRSMTARLMTSMAISLAYSTFFTAFLSFPGQSTYRPKLVIGVVFNVLVFDLELNLITGHTQ